MMEDPARSGLKQGHGVRGNVAVNHESGPNLTINETIPA